MRPDVPVDHDAWDAFRLWPKLPCNVAQMTSLRLAIWKWYPNFFSPFLTKNEPGDTYMATVKHGILTKAREWWKHLRPFNKRRFWKGERKAAKKDAVKRCSG